MGLLDGALGNASRMTDADAEKEFGTLLSSGETIQSAYKLVRDFIVFTNRRLVLVDKQGLTGKKVEYHSLPYRSITHFAIETSGHFDLDAELKIWVSGAQQPYERKFSKGVNIYEVQGILAEAICR